MARGMVSRGAKDQTMPPDLPDPHYEWCDDKAVKSAAWKAGAGISVVILLAGIGLAVLANYVWERLS